MIVLDYFKTPTAALADYIMPAADWMERPSCTTVEDAYDVFFGGDRAVQPEGERHIDFDFFRKLGIRCGQAEQWPWKTYEELIAHRVERYGFSYEEFVEEGILVEELREKKYEEIREDGQLRGFATPSRRVELYPSIFEELGYDPLPSYKELPMTPISNPEMAKGVPHHTDHGGPICTNVSLGASGTWHGHARDVSLADFSDSCKHCP